MSDRHQSKTLFVEELLYSNTIAQTLGNLLYSGEHQGDVLFDLCCQIKQLVLEVLFLCITFLVCLSFSIFFFFYYYYYNWCGLLDTTNYLVM